MRNHFVTPFGSFVETFQIFSENEKEVNQNHLKHNFLPVSHF
jgi:hypothetical protein